MGRPALLCGRETAQVQTADHSSSEGGLDLVVALSQPAYRSGVGVQTLWALRGQPLGPEH